MMWNPQIITQFFFKKKKRKQEKKSTHQALDKRASKQSSDIVSASGPALVSVCGHEL